MKIKSKIMGILMSLAVMACVAAVLVVAMGQVALAEESGESTTTTKSISLGTNAITNPTEDGDNYSYTKIYYGAWSAGGDKAPILWRVLGDWDGTTDRESTTKLLLSEYILTTGTFCGSDSNAWSGSDVQKWCQDFAGITTAGTSVNDAFSDKELAAIAATSKDDESTNGGFTNVGLSNEYVFLLSYNEVKSETYFKSNDDRKMTSGSMNYWWLRSGKSAYEDRAGVVIGGGTVNFSQVDLNRGIRPAFNLDLDSVLFTSAAADGKVRTTGAKAGTTGSFNAAESYDSGVWKVTLRDEDREFRVTTGDLVSNVGGTITISYDNATMTETEDDDEYISVIIAQETEAADDEDGAQEEVLYYGRMAELISDSGTISITLPEDLSVGNYTLKVFSEVYNGGDDDDTNLTDYASDFCTLDLMVMDTITASNYTNYESYGITEDNYTIYLGYYAITTPDELVGFASLVNDSGLASAKAVILADLDMSDYDGAWTGIGTSTANYAGTIDGFGHTISNLSGSAGLCGTTDEVTIKNLYLKDVDIAGSSQYLGALINKAQDYGCTIENCKVSGTVSSTYTSTYCYVGGLVGITGAYTTISNSCFEGDVIANVTSRVYLGGLVGCLYNAHGVIGNIHVDSCSFTGTINATSTATSTSETVGVYVGGLVGWVNNVYGADISNIAINAEITSTSYAGGLIGKGESFFVNISNIAINAKIKSATYAGGIFGRCETADELVLPVKNAYCAVTINDATNLDAVCSRCGTH